MLKRMKTIIVTVSALLALALGGVGAAQGASSHRHAQAKHHRSATSTKAHRVAHRSSTSASESQESTGESTESESGPGDGPGGHEDPEGTEVDHQFEGEE